MKVRSRARRAEDTRPADFLWIVDGHNAIFAVPEWERLQLAGQKREARQRLERRLEEFGRAIARQVWVVYDGNHLERNPDAVDRPFLRSFYSLPPEEADDRIRFLAQSQVRSGQSPVVVTSDRRTLAPSLATGVRWMEVREFLQGPARVAFEQPEKRTTEGMEDIERYWLGEAPPPKSTQPRDEDDEE